MRKVLIGSLAAVSVLVLAACGEDGLPRPEEVVESVEEGVAGAIPSVAAVDNSFAPDSFSAPAGEEITVSVVNSGQNPHSFTIDELGADTGVLQTGDTADVTFTMPDESVRYYCTVHGAETMSGQIDPS